MSERFPDVVINKIFLNCWRKVEETYRTTRFIPGDIKRDNLLLNAKDELVIIDDTDKDHISTYCGIDGYENKYSSSAFNFLLAMACCRFKVTEHFFSVKKYIGNGFSMNLDEYYKILEKMDPPFRELFHEAFCGKIKNPSILLKKLEAYVNREEELALNKN